VLRLAFTADYLDDTRPASFLKSDQRIKKPGDLSAGSATLATITGRAIHPPSKTGLSVAGRGEHRCGLAVSDRIAVHWDQTNLRQPFVRFSYTGL